MGSMKKISPVIFCTIFCAKLTFAGVLPSGVLPPEVPEDNPSSPAKVALGKTLYFDKRLSIDDTVSCATCHDQEKGFADGKKVGEGIKGQKGTRNSPTVLNAAFYELQFWDGRAEDLKEQAKGPIQASVEMGNTPEMVVKTLKSIPEYTGLFKKAFPGQADPVTFDNMAEAIEAFESTLITPGSPLDRYLMGDTDAISAAEKEGLNIFMDRGCVTCHNGINIGGGAYAPFGLVEKPPSEIVAGDTGRYKVTQSESDEYVFKIPSLRNIELTPPYFHSGKVWDLKEAIRIMGAAQLGAVLSPEEMDKIAGFLKTTTGVQPKVEYPILPAPTEQTPRPKLD